MLEGPNAAARSEPQRAAQSTASRAASSPADPAFLRVFAGTSLGLLIAVAAFNLLIDPLAEFGTGVVPPMVWLDRDDKADRYLHAPAPPAILILGSSRAMKINPRCVTELTGLPAFNFSVNSARAEDYEATFFFAVDHGKGAVRRALIGVDPEAFHNHVPADQRLQSSPSLRRYTSMPLPSVWSELPSQLWGQQTSSASVRSLYHALFEKSEPLDLDFGPDGFLTYPIMEAQVRTGTFNLAPRLTSTMEEYRNRFAEFTALSAPRLAAFERLLEHARKNGIAVDVFIVPVHPALEASLQSTTWPARLAETEALLARLDAQQLLHYHALPDLGSFGGDPAGFFDGAHMTERNSSKLIAKVLGHETACAVQ